jgi:hypothetical protein
VESVPGARVLDRARVVQVRRDDLALGRRAGTYSRKRAKLVKL